MNWGRSAALLKACKPLSEYSWLVAKVRELRAADQGADLELIIDRAIAEMSDEFEIKPFLTAHQAEVRGMLLTEYDEAKAMELFREDGRREGRREGALSAVYALVRRGLIAASDAAEQVGMTVPEFEQAVSELTTA